jgi:hypothetical protein
MKWVTDRTGRFAQRPHYLPEELDAEPHRGPGASAHSLSNGASLCILSTWLP